ncbi:MAG: hypothetical protein F8N37_00915 [Telmatospirillum sp.]|nr:hypothetical protein [Telmatospirillum sp.]
MGRRHQGEHGPIQLLKAGQFLEAGAASEVRPPPPAAGGYAPPPRPPPPGPPFGPGPRPVRLTDPTFERVDHVARLHRTLPHRKAFCRRPRPERCFTVDPPG